MDREITRMLVMRRTESGRSYRTSVRRRTQFGAPTSLGSRLPDTRKPTRVSLRPADMKTTGMTVLHRWRSAVLAEWSPGADL